MSGPVFFLGQSGWERGETSTHIHSEVFKTSEFAEVFLKFGVNVQIFGFGIFQEGPELLQPIQLTCRERGERGRERLGSAKLRIERLRRGRYDMIQTSPGRARGREDWDDQGSQSPNSLTLTSFIVLHGFLLKVLKYVQPELLFQAITVVSKKALQTISVEEHKPVKLGQFLYL